MTAVKVGRLKHLNAHEHLALQQLTLP